MARKHNSKVHSLDFYFQIEERAKILTLLSLAPHLFTHLQYVSNGMSIQIGLVLFVNFPQPVKLGIQNEKFFSHMLRVGEEMSHIIRQFEIN